MQAQVNLNAIRLTLDEQVVYSVFDLAAQIETARRVFLHSGNLVAALQDMRRIENQFEICIQSWEGDVTERERNKRGKSGNELARMKAEVSRVRNKINLTRRTLTKLRIELYSLSAQDPDFESAKTDTDSHALKQAQMEVLAETSLTAKVLLDLVGERLPLEYFSATRMVVGQLGAREQAWESNLAAMVMAGWYAAPNAKKGQFDIRIWIVPKSPKALDAIKQDHRDFQLSIEPRNGLPVELDWRLLSVDSPEAPQSHSLTPFLQKIKVSRFDSNNRQMELMCLTPRIPQTFWNNSTLNLTFRIVEANEQD